MERGTQWTLLKMINSSCWYYITNDPFNFDDFKCTCLPGFEPKFPRDWYNKGDGSGGCVRKKGESVCGNGEGFVKVVSLKVPDTSVAVAKGGLTLEECEKECLRNCSCTAYVVANVSNGGSGCLAWHGDLMDIQKLTDQGQDLFLRVDKVELGTIFTLTVFFFINLIPLRCSLNFFGFVSSYQPITTVKAKESLTKRGWLQFW
jgi:hypothetical protein